MKLVVQRVASCDVHIGGNRHSATKGGLLVLFGTRIGDTKEHCAFLCDKLVNLRIFEDADEKMNLSALDTKAEIMIVSQFTLYADTRKGRRPSFTDAMPPQEAEPLYDHFVSLVCQAGLVVKTGVFGAKMDVSLTNHGPVTIILEHPLA
jgi:D-tyrosyl-tRNA(Tyr) deacylase